MITLLLTTLALYVTLRLAFIGSTRLFPHTPILALLAVVWLGPVSTVALALVGVGVVIRR